MPIVRSHHEAWDGSGYPDGLKGEAIPLGARILPQSIVSMHSRRSGLIEGDARSKKQWPSVKSKSGILFDPQVVELLETHYSSLEEKARQHIEEIAPLKTDLFIERGAAPGS